MPERNRQAGLTARLSAFSKVAVLLKLGSRLAAVLALSGCGTLTTHVNGPSGVYSGVGHDMEKLATADEWTDWSVRGSAGSVPFLAPRGLLWILDTPLSLAADTIILPADLLRREHCPAEEP